MDALSDTGEVIWISRSYEDILELAAERGYNTVEITDGELNAIRNGAVYSSKNGTMYGSKTSKG